MQAVFDIYCPPDMESGNAAQAAATASPPENTHVDTNSPTSVTASPEKFKTEADTKAKADKEGGSSSSGDGPPNKKPRTC